MAKTITMTHRCQQCGREYDSAGHMYCSRKCFFSSPNKPIPPKGVKRSSFKKGHMPWNKGRTMGEEYRQKLSISHSRQQKYFTKESKLESLREIQIRRHKKIMSNDDIRKAIYERKREKRLNIKKEVLAHYSNSLKCVRCGYTNIIALSIDHIKGGGGKHRREIGGQNIYLWLKRRNYPEGYQVLCMNCQYVKRTENGEWGQGRARGGIYT